jgi:hypothetical protein
MALFLPEPPRNAMGWFQSSGWLLPLLSVTLSRYVFAAAMSDHPRTHPVKPERPDGALPVPVSPHLLTWWFGLMAAGGVGFGLYADERPFGNGVLAHPLVAFLACAVVGLLTLCFLHARPVLQLISARCLAAGAVIGIACFFIGTWFGANLIHVR